MERCAVIAAWIGAGALRPESSQLRAAAADPSGLVAARGADAVLGDLAAAGLWLACLWIALASGVVAATRLPGAGGAVAHAVARKVAPQVLRRSLALALGVGIAATPALAGADPAPSPGVSVAWPLTTDPSATDPSATDPSADPTSAGPTTAPPVSTPAPTDSAPPTRPDPAPGTQAPATSVLVQTGDTLWSIAATALGPDAGDADIAAAWPQWYRTNSEAIGADPDLIRPGITLLGPTSGDQR